MSKILFLHRVEIKSEVFGVLIHNQRRIAVTLENQRFIIPQGSYPLRSVTHKRFGKSVLLLKTEPRSGIYLHCGNFKEHSRGCILVAENIFDCTKIVTCRPCLDSIFIKVQTKQITHLQIN